METKIKNYKEMYGLYAGNADALLLYSEMEELHTKWLRNAKTYELALENAHIVSNNAYVVTRHDSEYGYRVFVGIAFTASDAFDMACQASYQWKNYESWLLVDENNLVKMLELVYAENCDANHDNTEVSIFWYTDRGTVNERVETMNLYAVPTFHNG